MDLAVDEQGLWVLCGTTNNDKRPTAGKIDVETNKIARNFYLSTGEHVFLMRQPLIQCCSLRSTRRFGQLRTFSPPGLTS